MKIIIKNHMNDKKEVIFEKLTMYNNKKKKGTTTKIKTQEIQLTA
jgi:hypothetical protein